MRCAWVLLRRECNVEAMKCKQVYLYLGACAIPDSYTCRTQKKRQAVAFLLFFAGNHQPIPHRQQNILYPRVVLHHFVEVQQCSCVFVEFLTVLG